eukprot:scaffold27748_cov72-Phaeocystis_antarctica.AAC.1
MAAHSRGLRRSGGVLALSPCTETSGRLWSSRPSRCGKVSSRLTARASCSRSRASSTAVAPSSTSSTASARLRERRGPRAGFHKWDLTTGIDTLLCVARPVA